MNQQTDIFVAAGEPSGDLWGALLVRQLRKLRPDLKITGIGGDQMAEAGAEIRANTVRDLAVIGLTEVISKFGKIRRLFKETVDYLRKERPKVVVLIDYPGFNLRLAKEAHQLGLKVVYYVVPQIWAWHKSRVHQLRKYVDRAIVILPFEEKMLRDAGVSVEYVGHPILDIMILTMGRDEVFAKFQFDPKKKLIGLLPGSRKREIESLLPVMVKAAEMIHRHDPNVQFVLPRASSVRRELIDRYLAGSAVPVQVVDSFRYNVRSTMDFALVASGTATLETGLLLCPMIILYKVSWITWLVGRWLVNIPYIGLINIIAGDMVVPELLQDHCTSRSVARRAIGILDRPDEILRVKLQLGKVKEKMGGPGASKGAARNVLEIYDQALRKLPPGESGPILQSAG